MRNIKKRKKWWTYARNVLYAYPEMKRCGPQSETERRELAAVTAAIDEIRQMEPSEASARLTLLRCFYWDRSHTLEGAAMAANISIATAWRWNGDVIRSVAKGLGLE